MAAITEDLELMPDVLIEERPIPSWATESAQRRFFSKIEKTDTCWIWTGGRFAHGYGAFKAAGKQRRAHRASYELLVGPIPPDLVLDHLCRNKICVRPDHLEPVTVRENTLRGETLAAANAVKTKCPRGHPYSPENTYTSPRRLRSCKTCKNEERRRRRQRERESRGGHN